MAAASPRVPTTEAELAKCIAAHEALGDDPFAVARWEYPGCKYVRLANTVVRARETGWETLIIAVPPTAPYFDMLPDECTRAMRDHNFYPPKPTWLPEITNPGHEAGSAPGA